MEVENQFLNGTSNKFDGLETILANLQDGVTLADYNGKYVYVNSAFCKMSGYSSKELLKLTVFDMSVKANSSNSFFELIKNRNDFEEKKITLRKKNGTEYFAEVRGKNIQLDGKPFILEMIKDITKQLEREQEILKLNKFKDAIYEGLPVGVAVYNESGKCISANEAIARIIGATHEEVLAQNYHQIESWKETGLYNKVLDALKFNRTEEFEFLAVSTFNKKVWVQCKVLPVISGNDIFMMLLINDISDRKQNEIALQQSEKKFKAIFNSTNVSIAILDTEGKIVDANKAVVSNFQTSKSFLLGSNSEKYTHINDIERTKKVIRDIVNGKKDSIRFEKRYLKDDGSVIWADASVSPIRNEKGDVTNIVTVVSDISVMKKNELELRESERRLKEAQRIGNLGHWEYDKVNQTVLWSDQMYHIFETSKDAFKLTIQNSLDFVHPDDKEFCSKEFQKLYESNIDGDFYYRIITALGNLKYAHTTFHVEYDADNNPIRFLGATADITKEKLIELDLKKSNNSKNKMFSIIAHDLRGPLSSIFGLSEILHERHKEMNIEEKDKIIEVIAKSSENIYKLLEDLLTWSRSQLGHIKYDPKVYELKNIVNEVLNILIEYAEAKNIKLMSNVKDNISFICDIEMIKTVLRNLVSNSIKFTPNGGYIIIEAFDDIEKIKVSVKDSGVGMSCNKIKEIFNVGKILSTKGTKQEKGTGLGLVLCKEFVDMHQGEINVESEEGKGSTFSICLPKILKK